MPNCLKPDNNLSDVADAIALDTLWIRFTVGSISMPTNKTPEQPREVLF